MAGDLMEPAIPHGAELKTNPHLPCKANDFCVCRKKNSDGAIEILNRQFVSSNERVFVVRQLNPKRTVELKRTEWQDCHKIVTIDLP